MIESRKYSAVQYSHCPIVHSVRVNSTFFAGLNARDPYYFHL